MKKLTSLFFSMQTMGILMFLFAFSIGLATFVENDFGSASAKALVYNSMWFNVLIFLLTVNLIGRIFISDMISLKKMPVLVFHIAFVIIVIGAAITRFISYEGVMHIREGNSSSVIMSNATYVMAKVGNEANSEVTENEVLMSPLSKNAYHDNIRYTDVAGNKHKIRLRSTNFIPNATEVVKENSENGIPIIMLIISDGVNRMDTYLEYGNSVDFLGTGINFSGKPTDDLISIGFANNGFTIIADDTITKISMMSQSEVKLLPNEYYQADVRELYNVRDISIVITDFYPQGEIAYEPHPEKGTMMDAIVVDVSVDGESEEVVIRGGKGYQGIPKKVNVNGVSIELSYGAKMIDLPFSLELKEFTLDRYPGSNSPSSYSSEIVLLDDGLEIDYRIYMNNVLNYGGYRFFQSSYDPDEMGTILSVSYDYWGTRVTYIGYFFMSIAMILAIFFGNSYFKQLGVILKKKKSLLTIAALMLAVLPLSAQNVTKYEHIAVDDVEYVPEKQAKAFGELVVLSDGGRFKPVNSLASEILRKVSRKDNLGNLNADQVMLGLMSNPSQWQSVAMIRVSDPEIGKMLGINGKYAAYLDFVDLNKGEYKLANLVNAAYEKTPSKRDRFEKELLKVDERLNVWFMAYTGEMLNILPNPENVNAPWYSPSTKVVGLPYDDSLFIATAVPVLLESVKQRNFNEAEKMITAIGNYQKKYAGNIMPTEAKIQYEILYNKWDIFNNLSRLYGIAGVLMLLLVFIELFKPGKTLRVIINVFIGIVILGFLLQTLGLGLRWYISGHAPWSDGYETMIYVGWITLLAGLLFGRGSRMTIAATTILTSIILMVAHLSWMDPEITNLVPVLKSYWLTIHVSVITASYGFLALSSLLGFINLILMIVKNKKNAEKINFNIASLTAINGRSMIIGLYLLTIGTFLGGIWANESWGRYWGWDPKESWALISVVVYAFIAHMHKIKGLQSRFAFNFATLVAYGVILMTFFGVNYYLSGLHSYAKGDPVPIPAIVYYVVIVIALISIWAGNKERADSKSK